MLRDYCDGTEYAKHPLTSLDPQFLQLFLYYDDLEVCNPIGSKRIIHKLGKVLAYVDIITCTNVCGYVTYSCILLCCWQCGADVAVKGATYSVGCLSKKRGLEEIWNECNIGANY